MRPRQTAADFDQDLLNLYDEYVHGRVDRRGFLERASRFTVGGVTAASLLQMLSPNYALAEQVAKDDPRIEAAYAEYDSPQGAGKMRGVLVKPAKAAGKVPGVIVIHENRGLNPYVEDVARRVATAGYVAFAPDALFPLGGYPGSDDEGRTMQAKRDQVEMTEDFIAAAKWLSKHEACNGKMGVVGFCYGGGMSNTLAVRLPELILAAVPFYGRQPAVADVPKIKGALLIHYAENDPKVNEGWPAYEAALKEANTRYTAHTYPGTNHGFHNDTTPRYDEAAAKLAWERTITFFDEMLKGA
ncbi:dienelactone hydrolase family protein [Phragmitibacter flavus]|uniref:Dienelactone hydrolase family protein n=2 Tax=Phragmitibacter flavus TaxID=2576071 RepID=A0A5R8K9A0_9BACT|nr:dienelactone hydrolase family protein [Phragmitibacter flavus]